MKKHMTRLLATTVFGTGLALAPTHATTLDPPNCGARVTYVTLVPGSSTRSYTWTYRNCGSKSVKVKIVRRYATDLGCYTVAAGSFRTVRWDGSTNPLVGGTYDKTVTC